jgi:hypothetical protein
VSLFNHQLAFRPLLGGIEIYVPRVDEVGTLGLLAQDVVGSDERWLVSCYHVLVGSPGTVPVAGEGVLQPASAIWPVAFIDALRADSALDCAAARIDSGVEIAAEILGIGAAGIPADPEIGMRVIKSGAATGVTEGVIEGINGDDVIIGLPPGFDSDYDLSLPGDSGSIWLSQKGHSPVALHLRSGLGPRKTVEAKRVLPILHALRLSIAA